MVLAEIYITFEVIAFVIFIKGLETENNKQIIYPLLSMMLFLTLAVSGGDIQSIFTGDTVTSELAIYVNWAFGMISIVYFFVVLLTHLRVLENKKVVDDI